MNSRTKKLLRGMLFLFPLLLGFTGLLESGEKLLDALFSAITMYGMNYGETPPNTAVQLARWTAPLATASGIAMIFTPVIRDVRARLYNRLGNSVAVYGDREIYEQIKKTRSYPVVQGAEKLLPAHSYVLFGEEQENLRFYLTHQEELQNREVFLRCESLRSQEIGGGRLHLYCMEEVGARLFWKQAGLLEQFARKKDVFRIAMIGFGRLGEQLLLWGLQNNVFSPDQRICYDVFGDENGFLQMHRELPRVSDSIAFHDNWQEKIPLLQSADRILVCQQEQQLLLTEQLLFTLNGKVLDILAADPQQMSLLEDQERLRIFPWKEAALQPENLFDARTLMRAKAINLRYAHLYGGVEETAENAETEWDKLNSFTRYSNISAADYHEIRLQMLASWGLPVDAERIPPEKLELLAELEHIRWERFHYLNNWRPGEPANGKTKDPQQRIHKDLIPFRNLTDAEKEKDRENVRVLLTIP